MGRNSTAMPQLKMVHPHGLGLEPRRLEPDVKGYTAPARSSRISSAFPRELYRGSAKTAGNSNAVAPSFDYSCVFTPKANPTARPQPSTYTSSDSSRTQLSSNR